VGGLFQLARQNAMCDYGLYLGASEDNAQTLPGIASGAVALKMYLNTTFSTLKMDNVSDWMKVNNCTRLKMFHALDILTKMMLIKLWSVFACNIILALPQLSEVTLC
jgi:hypothetical protein